MAEAERAGRAAHLTLSLLPGIGAMRLEALVARFGSAAATLAAPFPRLVEVPGISAAAATTIASADPEAGRRALADLERLGGRLLLPGDSSFPGSLRTIPDPPSHLFAMGNLSLLERPIVAIVGSRDHTAYGEEVCRSLARSVAEAGLVVVSGMARGLDAVAHAGALDGHGGTIGVLGNGFGVIYPAANRELYERVASLGLLVTEFPPGERPHPGSFPRRNRLISGLARVVVVVEAALQSGALQTVTCALEQGRDVLAVPGPITSPVSAGTNRLIRDGAAPLLELPDLQPHFHELTPVAAGAGAPGSSLPVLERRLVQRLTTGPRRLDELVEAGAAPAAATLDALASLELGGRVVLEAGGLYRLDSSGLFR